MMIAIATAASAAAIVMMNIVKKMPSSLSGYRYLLNTTKFMFTLFNISSIDISIVIMLRRVNNPYMPMKNNAVLTNKIFEIGISIYSTSSFSLMSSNFPSPFSLVSNLVECVGVLIAITIQPTIAANNKIVTTSKGNA